MSRFPSFTEAGVLPSGDHLVTLDELRGSILVNGIGVRDALWDVVWRHKLVRNLERLVGQLAQVGIREVFVDGSFVENKSHPNDIDGYFECDLEDLVQPPFLVDRLNALESKRIWGWASKSRRPHPDSIKWELPMWHEYRVELYPHYGQPSNIKDRDGNELEFPSAFRRNKATGRQRGILKIGGL